MRHSRSFVTLIEAEIDANPFCACGARMKPVDHDGDIWLECATHDEVRSGFLARIRSLIGHDRKLVQAGEDLAA
jgi:hypothetical protein